VEKNIIKIFIANHFLKLLGDIVPITIIENNKSKFIVNPQGRGINSLKNSKEELIFQGTDKVVL